MPKVNGRFKKTEEKKAVTMLLPETKSLLKFSADRMIASIGLSEMLKESPITYIEWTENNLRRGKSPLSKTVLANIEANRREAQMFIAGLMGLL